MATAARPKPSSFSPAKSAARRPARPSRAIEIAVIAAVLLAACGHLLIKHGLNTTLISADSSIFWRLSSYLMAPLVFGGLLVYATGTLLWIAAVSKLDISYVYPVTALNYVVITLGGMWLLGESVSKGRWAGILIVILGVGLMHTSAQEREQ
jgi:drug/metabolite transporter (DMT)-like permease